MLREQLRQRESAAAAAQVAKMDAERRANSAESRVTELEQERVRLATLVEKLESDLSIKLADFSVAGDDPTDELAQLKYEEDDEDEDDEDTNDRTVLREKGSAASNEANRK